MKKILSVLVAVSAMAAFAETKFGVVDMMVLVRNHPNYESNKTLLTSTDKDYKRKLDVIRSEGESLQEEGKKLADQMRNPMLIAKARGEIEKQIMEIQQKLGGVEQRYRAETVRCRQDLQDLEARLLKTTTDDLRKRISRYAEENGYDFIFDSTAAVYSKNVYDVTDALLKAMGVSPKDAKGRNEGK